MDSFFVNQFMVDETAAMNSSTALVARGEDSLIFVMPVERNVDPTLLLVNLIMRLILAPVAIILNVAPLRQLYQSGEFAATVFVGNLIVVNIRTIVNALIWRNDNTDDWWPGYGVCDLNPYVHNIQVALFPTCLLAVMRNLSQQVGLMRANPLTVKEKRRRNMFQALIMFPLPIIQLAFVWPLTSQRYVVATLVGCAWSGWPSWPYIFLFAATPVFIAILTAGYSILVFIRFREVAQSTRSALTSNRSATMRAQRTKRRLYLMVMSILGPFLPIVIALAVVNIRAASPLLPFDYNEIHHHTLPLPWNTIIYFRSGKQEFAFLNNCYIPIFASLSVFIFFGMTKNAMNDYRQVLVFFGLGRIFPILYEEYDPDRSAYDSALSSNATNATNSSNSTAQKIRTIFSSRQADSANASSRRSSQMVTMRSQSIALSSIDIELGHQATNISMPPTSHAAMDNHRNDEDTTAQLTNRNPFLYRTHMNFSVPSSMVPSFLKKKPAHAPNEPGRPLQPAPSGPPGSRWDPQPHPSRIQTRVWSDDESPILERSTTDAETVHRPSSSDHKVKVQTQVIRETDER